MNQQQKQFHPEPKTVEVIIDDFDKQANSDLAIANGVTEGLSFGDVDDVRGLYLEVTVPCKLLLNGSTEELPVTLAPNAQGALHAHPEEQWGVMLEGDGVRTQGGQAHPVRAGDFWRTPGGMPHSLKAGPDGARVLDIFSPPREEYRSPGSGFEAD